MEADKTILLAFLNSFKEIPTADFDLISQHLQHRAIAPGQVLLQQGKTAKELFFVASALGLPFNASAARCSFLACKTTR